MTIDKENIVVLNTNSYNTIKAYNTKAQILIDYILDSAIFIEGKVEKDKLVFISNDSLINAFQMCFPEIYKKKLEEKKLEYLAEKETLNADEKEDS